MGRFVKNTELKASSTAIRLPLGTTAFRPEMPVDGQLRMNTSLSRVEMYYNGMWHYIAKIGRVNLVEDTFTTADATTQYGPMTYSYDAGQEANVVVYVGGVMQKPGINYNFQGNTDFLLDPTDGTAGQTITVIHNINSTDAV